MRDRPNHDRVVPVADLRDYFRTSIDEVITKQGVEVDPHAAHYVVNLITLFARSEEFYDDEGCGLKPLALMLADAADAPNVELRAQSLQRIGDVALFISGFFIDSLASKAVDVDYYIYMGESAYGSLSEEIRGTFRGNAFADVYRELAAKFQILIDVLNEVRDGARRESDMDLLRTYKIWLKTGSRRAENLLRLQGIVPFSDAKKLRH
ncbi:MAG: hypothetical protein OEO82_02590 [Gammaproteobacteria bacterium]|nr:hypothetical protein [Gammaproteobacteria bacterium]